jgi:hypothetical protein
MARHEVDATLKHLLGDPRDDEPITGSEPRDVVGDFFHEQQFGVPKDGAKPLPLTIEQIAKSLTSLRQALRTSPSSSRKELLAKLSAAAQEYCPENSFVCQFLKAAAAADDEGMKVAVKSLIEANKTQVFDLRKAVNEPSSMHGEPNSIQKINGWTFEYDAAGEVAQFYLGDEKPAFFN